MAHDTPPPGIGGRLRITRRIWWLILSVAATLPFLVTAFPPLLDYPQWLFQGHLVHLLLNSGGSDPVNAAYELRWRPIPNAAAAIGIGLLSTWLAPPDAGRVFVLFGALLFAYAFAYLVRSEQGRPTVIEFLGFPWAFGYFMYYGFVSYLISLPIALYAIARIHRIVARCRRSLTTADVAALTALSTLLYLCHLFGWLVLMLALAVYTALLLRRRSWRDAIVLSATSVPALAMLAWYTGESAGRGATILYGNLPNKAISFIGPLLLFLRTDPFEAIVSVFWLNVVTGIAIIGVLIANLDRTPRRRPSRILLAVAVVLSVFILIIPFHWYGGLHKPDERFALPAFLVALAALPYKSFSARRGAMAGVVVLLILAVHVVEYDHVGGLLAQVHGTRRATIPPNAFVASVSVHGSPVRSACGAHPIGLSIGIATANWSGMYYLIETGQLRANQFGTSLIVARFDVRPSEGQVAQPLDMLTWAVAPEEIRAEATLVPELTRYAFVEAMGCQEHIASLRAMLAPDYEAVASGPGYEVFRRRP